jgi:hypothetical protein
MLPHGTDIAADPAAPAAPVLVPAKPPPTVPPVPNAVARPAAPAAPPLLLLLLLLHPSVLVAHNINAIVHPTCFVITNHPSIDIHARGGAGPHCAQKPGEVIRFPHNGAIFPLRTEQGSTRPK